MPQHPLKTTVVYCALMIYVMSHVPAEGSVNIKSVCGDADDVDVTATSLPNVNDPVTGSVFGVGPVGPNAPVGPKGPALPVGPVGPGTFSAYVTSLLPVLKKTP